MSFVFPDKDPRTPPEMPCPFPESKRPRTHLSMSGGEIVY